jgi:hypothetical protein
MDAAVDVMTGLERKPEPITYARWRERVEDELAEHRRRGKAPKAEPATEAEWRALYVAEPVSLYAAWFAITGRRVGERPS